RQIQKHEQPRGVPQGRGPAGSRSCGTCGRSQAGGEKRMSAYRFVFIMSAPVLALAACTACTVFRNDPWDGKLYVGDSSKGALVRSQDNEEIACTDKRADEMVCMPKADFKDLLTKWREARSNCPAPPAAEELKEKPTEQDTPAPV